MPNLDLYPVAILTALAVAGAASYATGIPLATTVVLVLAGLVVAGFSAYRPVAAQSAAKGPVQRVLQALIAQGFRVAIGTLVIAIATIAALRVAGVWLP